MTRKQAIIYAISVLCEKHADEAATVLESIIEDLPMNHWSEAACLDAIDQWILDKGKLPTVKQFDNSKLLPSHATVRNRFGMGLAEFLESRYKMNPPRVLYGKTMDEWQMCFIENYNSIKPTSAKEYDLKRPVKTPQWHTIAKACGSGGWSELLEHLGLQPYYKRRQAQAAMQFTVIESGGIAEYDKKLTDTMGCS